MSKIQTTVPDAHGHYIPERENPLTAPSAACRPANWSTGLWWQGPSWFEKTSLDWPTVEGLIDEEMLPEKRAKAHATGATTTETEELLRFSCLSRLLRVTARCRRWLLRRQNQSRAVADPDSVSGESLSTTELDNARLLWIRLTQAANFKSELIALRQNRDLLKASQIN